MYEILQNRASLRLSGPARVLDYVISPVVRTSPGSGAHWARGEFPHKARVENRAYSITAYLISRGLQSKWGVDQSRVYICASSHAAIGGGSHH